MGSKLSVFINIGVATLGPLLTLVILGFLSGGDLGCSTLGSPRPLYFKLVGFSFSAKTKDLFIGVMAIKKIGKGLGI